MAADGSDDVIDLISSSDEEPYRETIMPDREEIDEEQEEKDEKEAEEMHTVQLQQQPQQQQQQQQHQRKQRIEKFQQEQKYQSIQDPDDSEDSEDKTNGFSVAEIRDLRLSPADGTMEQFLAHWNGYDSDWDTWEPIEHLQDCVELVCEFRRRREQQPRSAGIVHYASDDESEDSAVGADIDVGTGSMGDEAEGYRKITESNTNSAASSTSGNAENTDSAVDRHTLFQADITDDRPEMHAVCGTPQVLEGVFSSLRDAGAVSRQDISSAAVALDDLLPGSKDIESVSSRLCERCAVTWIAAWERWLLQFSVVERVTCCNALQEARYSYVTRNLQQAVAVLHTARQSDIHEWAVDAQRDRLLNIQHNLAVILLEIVALPSVFLTRAFCEGEKTGQSQLATLLEESLTSCLFLQQIARKSNDDADGVSGRWPQLADVLSRVDSVAALSISSQLQPNSVDVVEFSLPGLYLLRTIHQSPFVREWCSNSLDMLDIGGSVVTDTLNVSFSPFELVRGPTSLSEFEFEYVIQTLSRLATHDRVQYGAIVPILAILSEDESGKRLLSVHGHGLCRAVCTILQTVVTDQASTRDDMVDVVSCFGVFLQAFGDSTWTTGKCTAWSIFEALTLFMVNQLVVLSNSDPVDADHDRLFAATDAVSGMLPIMHDMVVSKFEKTEQVSDALRFLLLTTPGTLWPSPRMLSMSQSTDGVTYSLSDPTRDVTPWQVQVACATTRLALEIVDELYECSITVDKRSYVLACQRAIAASAGCRLVNVKDEIAQTSNLSEQYDAIAVHEWSSLQPPRLRSVAKVLSVRSSIERTAAVGARFIVRFSQHDAARLYRGIVGDSNFVLAAPYFPFGHWSMILSGVLIPGWDPPAKAFPSTVRVEDMPLDVHEHVLRSLSDILVLPVDQVVRFLGAIGYSTPENRINWLLHYARSYLIRLNVAVNENHSQTVIDLTDSSLSVDALASEGWLSLFLGLMCSHAFLVRCEVRKLAVLAGVFKPVNADGDTDDACIKHLSVTLARTSPSLLQVELGRMALMIASFEPLMLRGSLCSITSSFVSLLLERFDSRQTVQNPCVELAATALWHIIQRVLCGENSAEQAASSVRGEDALQETERRRLKESVADLKAVFRSFRRALPRFFACPVISRLPECPKATSIGAGSIDFAANFSDDPTVPRAFILHTHEDWFPGLLLSWMPLIVVGGPSAGNASSAAAASGSDDICKVFAEFRSMLAMEWGLSVVSVLWHMRRHQAVLGKNSIAAFKTLMRAKSSKNLIGAQESSGGASSISVRDLLEDTCKFWPWSANLGIPANLNSNSQRWLIREKSIADLKKLATVPKQSAAARLKRPTARPSTQAGQVPRFVPPSLASRPFAAVVGGNTGLRAPKQPLSNLSAKANPKERGFTEQTFLDALLSPTGGEGIARRIVPNQFQSSFEFTEVFGPLLLDEVRSQLAASREEAGPCFSVDLHSDTVRAIDKFHQCSIKVTAAESELKQWRIDTVIVLRRKVGSALQQVQAVVRQQSKWAPNRVFATAVIQMRFESPAAANAFLRPSSSNANQTPIVLQVQRIGSFSTARRELEAMFRVRDGEISERLLRSVLNPGIVPQVDRLDVAKSLVSSYILRSGERLNDPQKSAVETALSCSGFTLIQGPPGTGKTKCVVAIVTALVELCKQQHSNSQGKILVCTSSNAAVDEIIFRLLQLPDSFEKMRLVRLGEESTMRQSSVAVSLDVLAKQSMDNPRSDFARAREAAAERANRDKELREQIDKYTDRLGIVRAALDADGSVSAGQTLADLEHEKLALNQKLKDTHERLRVLRSVRTKQQLDRAEHAAQIAVIANSDVIFCTLSTSGSGFVASLLEDEKIDTVVIDEAAQAVELSTLIPLKFASNRCIMIGDPKQLPATVFANDAERHRYDWSLFARLAEGGHPVSLLSIQYRMHPDIRRFPSREFYENRLEDGAIVRSSEYDQPFHKHPLFPPYAFFDVKGFHSRGASHSRTTGTASLRNDAEVKFVVELLTTLAHEFPSLSLAKSAAVITPYRQQMREIQFALDRSRSNRLQGIQVATVDSFQGREMDIIIVSTVRAHSGTTGSMGFLSDVRRLNVAITRAKFCLAIVGSADTLQGNPVWHALIEDANERKCLFSAASALDASRQTQQHNIGTVAKRTGQHDRSARPSKRARRANDSHPKE